MPLLTKSLLALAVSALALSACTTVGPNFKTPDGPKGAASAGYAMAGDTVAPGVRLCANASGVSISSPAPASAVVLMKSRRFM